MSTYLLIGDSQGVGLEDELREEMAARGYRQVGGVNHVGWTTGRMAREGRVADLPPAELAIVVLGGNDTAGAPLEHAVNALVGQIPAVRVVWVGPAHVGPSEPRIAARKREVAAQQRDLARRIGFVWFDGAPMTRDLEHAPDDLHFGRTAQRVWARRIAALDFTGRGGGWGAVFATALAVTGGALLGFGAYYVWRAR